MLAVVSCSRPASLAKPDLIPNHAAFPFCSWCLLSSSLLTGADGPLHAAALLLLLPLRPFLSLACISHLTGPYRPAYLLLLLHLPSGLFILHPESFAAATSSQTPPTLAPNLIPPTSSTCTSGAEGYLSRIRWSKNLRAHSLSHTRQPPPEGVRRPINKTPVNPHTAPPWHRSSSGAAHCSRAKHAHAARRSATPKRNTAQTSTGTGGKTSGASSASRAPST
ncbi:hypothetical protein HDK77DRAFT_233750 [Phyllosticta capitalensis]